MSDGRNDGWEDGYNDSLDDGHEFAEEHLSLPGDPFSDEEGGHGLTMEDPHAEKLGGGVFLAMYEGDCVICTEPIHVGDPITGKGVKGYRHAGCSGEQIFRTRYNKDEEASNEFLSGND